MAAYESDLAQWMRQGQQELEDRRADEEVEGEELDEGNELEITADIAGYENVPVSGAYITRKETKYRFFISIGIGVRETLGRTNTSHRSTRRGTRGNDGVLSKKGIVPRWT